MRRVRRHAARAIALTEKALKKHLSLIKHKEHVAPVVAMIEQLRGDLRGADADVILQHLGKLNELTSGFVTQMLKSKGR